MRNKWRHVSVCFDFVDCFFVLTGCVEAQRQAAAVEVSTIAYGETNVAFQRTEEHFGVFPGNIAPPPPYSGKQNKFNV